MNSLLYAWEFGANFGHIGAFLPLGRALRDSGHQVHWTVAQTAPAARLLEREGFTWLQAPLATERPRSGPPLTYADILLRFGYADADDLRGLVVAWRELMRLSGTRLVLTDHAPTAVLAARTLGLPVMLFSNGFTVPPRQRPLPNMRPWTALAEAQLLALEDAALASVNTVLAHFGQAPLDALWKLFDVAEEALITYPELDHYEQRGPARYWGSLPNAAIGAAPPWPDRPGKRLFAYLRPETPHVEAVLSALQALSQPTVVYLPGLSPEARQRWQSPHLVFVAEPVDIAAAARSADAAITYSSLATTTAVLLEGKPLLLLPSHLEQFLLARRVAAMGAGIAVNPEQPAGDLRPALHTLLEQPAFTENARIFAAKYAAFGQDTVIANLVKRIETLCAGQGTP
ncbi:MAG: hypothetical protein M0P39_02335 [Rhodocyclaceae bacterium]|nr:hypothetical protein [Rhodocyclaceae bacterium]